jgi:hypothetical protein
MFKRIHLRVAVPVWTLTALVAIVEAGGKWH